MSLVATRCEQSTFTFLATARTGISVRFALACLWGHQFAGPINVVRAGTVTVRTTNVSIKMPMPMMNPVCTMVERLPNNRPDIDAAKINPAEVMTPPVERTARMTPERTPLRDSSRIRVIKSRL
jgi:hypothetical protein